MNEEEVKHRMFREHVKLVLERVGKSCERWPFYQNVRGRVVEQLNASEDSGLTLEEKELLLTDCEISVTIVSYYMGFQAGYRWAREEDSDAFMRDILKLFEEL